jgi:hypothetical protein
VLPDFRRVKRRIAAVLNERLRRGPTQGAVSIASEGHQHEGTSSRIDRSDGSGGPLKMQEFKTSFRLSFDDIPRMTMADVVRIVDEQAFEIAEQKQKMFAQFMQEVSPEMQQMPATAAPTTPEGVLEMLQQKAHMDFDRNGEPSLVLVVHPSKVEAVTMAQEAVGKDPVLSARRAEILALKREEWRAREASRTLVG